MMFFFLMMFTFLHSTFTILTVTCVGGQMGLLEHWVNYQAWSMCRMHA